MKILGLSDIDLNDLGLFVNLTGTLWRDKRTNQVYILPLSGYEYEPDYHNISVLLLDTQESIQFINQAWLLEGRKYEGNRGKQTTVALARTKKQIESQLVWQVFRRDNFACVYCGDEKGPMTYDHYIPECQNGPTNVENGRTSCRPCNSLKGDLHPDEWLNSQKLRQRKRWIEKCKKRREQKCQVNQ